MTIGVRIGKDADFRTIYRARTNEAGSLEATVPVPEQAQKGDEITSAVETVEAGSAWFPNRSMLVMLPTDVDAASV